MFGHVLSPSLDNFVLAEHHAVKRVQYKYVENARLLKNRIETHITYMIMDGNVNGAYSAHKWMGSVCRAVLWVCLVGPDGTQEFVARTMEHESDGGAHHTAQCNTTTKDAKPGAR